MHPFFLLFVSLLSAMMVLPEDVTAQSAGTKPAAGQTVRGRTLDAVTNAPVPRVTVRILRNDSLVRGSVSDTKGVFRCSGLVAGRYTLVAQCIGYNPVRMDNVLVTSGKEVVMDIPMSESSVQSKELVVTHSREQDELMLNSEMAMVSGRTFNTEDTKRYAGALGDPSRMAQNFAGVVGAN
ncbi:MAG: carboxypeptidase-like regulatory domain-containing protein, partial [Candidatus Kapaibacterium sp.]